MIVLWKLTWEIVKRHLFEIILISLNHDEEGIKYASHTFLRTFTCHIETAKKPWLSNFLTDFNEPLPKLLFSSITFFVCWQILFLFRLSFSKMSHNWDSHCFVNTCSKFRLTKTWHEFSSKDLLHWTQKTKLRQARLCADVCLLPRVSFVH